MTKVLERIVKQPGSPNKSDLWLDDNEQNLELKAYHNGEWKNVSVGDSVSFSEQTLTAEEKAQARTNIGAGTSNFSGNYNNLTNKPKAVLYTSQTLTDAQKEQARENIGALSSCQEITHYDLKSLRDAGSLIPGCYYRITDYNCTTTQENTQSAGHQFDIIVTALSESVLSEEASAIQHSGDTYFSSNDLNAWKLWYCLDNDTNRFAWADSTNGKGVIYRMIDEFNNDVPYDFKNIQFKRMISLANGYPELDTDNGADTWVYTFAATSYHITNAEWSGLKDGSLESPYGHESDENAGTYYDNIIGKYILLYDYDEDDYTKCGKQYLNDNVFLGHWEEVGSDDPENYPYYYAYCSYGCKFGLNCYSNTLGSWCNSNTFGDNCLRNTFGNACGFNTFGANCDSNTFVSNCSHNILGDNCASNTFGNNCTFNTFDTYCQSNTFGEICHSNTFGIDCSSNIFGTSCLSNTFGNNCAFNTFGNNCPFNTFGNSCKSIKFGKSNSTKSYYRYIIVENGNQYIYLNCTATTSSSNYYQNITIVQGVNNTNTWKTITDSNVNQSYQTKVAVDTNGNTKIYCEADLVQ